MRKFKGSLAMILIIIISVTGGCNNLDKDKRIEETGELRVPPRVTSSFSSEDIIYFIMTDRFFDGDASNNEAVNRDDLLAYHGGDIRGIIKKLDYIADLGATTIWITPVAENEEGGYHGYWTKDFYKVDPRLGTMEDLKELVIEAHNRDIKVILDYVVNHTGYNSPWLKDEKHKSWFNPPSSIKNWYDQKQVEEGWLAGLPDLNHNLPEVRNYFVKNALWWIAETGIDGMRIDTVKHVPKVFWIDFIDAIKEEYPEFYLIGEVWHDDVNYLQQYKELGFDGLANFPLYNGIRNTFIPTGKTYHLMNAIENDKKLSNPYMNGIFMDNHDTVRHISAAGGQGFMYYKQALAFIMTYPAIPVIYYGTEIAMEGAGDPDNRRFMEWEGTESSEALDFYLSLVELRKANPALKKGDFRVLQEDTYYASYGRSFEEDSVIVAFNLEAKENKITIVIPYGERNYINYLSGEAHNVIDGVLQLQLPPAGLIILVSKQ